jgi:hypothetical protein
MALKLHSARVRDHEQLQPLPARSCPPLPGLGRGQSRRRSANWVPRVRGASCCCSPRSVRVAHEPDRDGRRSSAGSADPRAARRRICGSISPAPPWRLTGFQVIGQTRRPHWRPDWHAHLGMEKSTGLVAQADASGHEGRALPSRTPGPSSPCWTTPGASTAGSRICCWSRTWAGTSNWSWMATAPCSRTPRSAVGRSVSRPKGHADDDRREAMLLVRWHSFVGALEMEDDWQQFELGDARARFDAYRPGTTGLPSRAGARTQPADSAGKAPPGPGKGRTAASQADKGPHGNRNLFLEYDP